MIYLDHAATTPTDPRVVDAMMPYLTYEFGNPGSLHCYGREAKEAVDHARKQTARFFNCEPEQIIFTSGGTEGNNTVFSGLVPELKKISTRRAIVVSAVEHDSVWKSAHRMRQHGFSIWSVVPTISGEITRGAVLDVLDDTVGLVSVMAANNETGVVNDVPGIGNVCRNRGVLFHSDAVQFASVEIPDTKETFAQADFVTVSGHKFGGPKGTGALFVRNPELLSPLIVGGADQEFGFRGGTENVPGIVGFGEACEIRMNERIMHLASLGARFNRMLYLLKHLAGENKIDIHINGSERLLMPKTLNVCFPGVDAQSLVLLLDSNGICVSAGSACRAHENVPSRTLTAMGLSPEEARSSIRISVSHLNTMEEIDRAANAIIYAVNSLKAFACPA